MGTRKKQTEIRDLIASLGWSIRQLADVLYEELYCDDYEDLQDVTPEAVSSFYEKLKKHLKRETTSEKRLDAYLKAITEHPDYLSLKLNMVPTKYINHSCLDDEFTKLLSEFSSELDRVGESK
ncbi:elongation factor Ts [Vibrio harveyi]